MLFKNIRFLIVLFFLIPFLVSAQEEVTKLRPRLVLDKDYPVVIGEAIMSDGSHTRPSKPTTVRFENFTQENQKYVKTIFEDEKFAHTFYLQLDQEVVDEEGNYREYYSFKGENDEGRIAKITYYPEQMSLEGKDVNLNLQMAGYWGKMRYNLFFNTQSKEKITSTSQNNPVANPTNSSDKKRTNSNRVTFKGTDPSKGNFSTELVDHAKLFLKNDGKVIAFVDLTFSNIKRDKGARVFNYAAKGLGFNKLTILDMSALSISERKAFMKTDDESPAIVYLSGDGDKKMYIPSTILGTLLPPDNGETEKSIATIHQEFTTAFKALENGFKNERKEVQTREKNLVFYATGLELGAFGNEYILERTNDLNSYHAASIKGNQTEEQQLLNALKNYADPNYKIVALPSTSRKKHFAIEKGQEVIGFLEYGKDAVLSKGLVSIILKEAIDANQLKLSIEKGYKTLKNNPELLKGEILGQGEGMVKYQVENHLYGAMVSYIINTEKENSWSWTNGFLNSSFEGLKYLIKDFDFNIKGTKDIGTFDENFQRTDKLEEIRYFKISFSSGNEKFNIILANDPEGRGLMELGFTD